MLNIIFFYTFAAILVLSAIKVVTVKNPVHAVLFLVLTFVTASCLWIMINVEFLALVLILVYVGAVMVLFLFVVMMLDIDIESLRQGFWKNLPLAFLLGFIVLIEMVLVLILKPFVIKPSNIEPMLSASEKTTNLFLALYTQYSFAVELASLILLLGLVVVVALTLRNAPKNANAKYQKVSKQHSANPKDCLEMIKMEAVRFEIKENVEIKENGNELSFDKSRLDKNNNMENVVNNEDKKMVGEGERK